jgi:hypothetical protein
MPDRSDDATRRPVRPFSRPFRTPAAGTAGPAPSSPETARRSVGAPFRTPFVPTPAPLTAVASVVADAVVAPAAIDPARELGRAEAADALEGAIAAGAVSPAELAADASAASWDESEGGVAAAREGDTAAADPADQSAPVEASSDAERSGSAVAEGAEQHHAVTLLNRPADEAASAVAGDDPQTAGEPAITSSWLDEFSAATSTPESETPPARSPSAEAWPEDAWRDVDDGEEEVKSGDLWRAAGPDLRSAFGGVGAPDSVKDESSFYFPPSVGSAPEEPEAVQRGDPARRVGDAEGGHRDGLTPELRAMNTPETAAAWSRLTTGSEGGTPPMPLAEALELLASRIRSGALEASGYEPGMGDAAALTAALAAVLGVKR